MALMSAFLLHSTQDATALTPSAKPGIVPFTGIKPHPHSPRWIGVLVGVFNEWSADDAGHNEAGSNIYMNWFHSFPECRHRQHVGHPKIAGQVRVVGPLCAIYDVVVSGLTRFPHRMGKRDIRDIFATNLRRLRNERGFSQEALAHESGVGRSYMSRIEKGAYYASLRIIERLAATLKVDASELLKLPTRAGRKNG